jgi:hypothetical protein
VKEDDGSILSFGLLGDGSNSSATEL